MNLDEEEVQNKVIVRKDHDKIIGHLLKEWEVIINTQMHFNDLILRFRSTILTVIATLTGAIFAIYKTTDIEIGNI